MDILVINAGSSSLKYQVINVEEEKLIAKGIVERIGIEGSNLQHTPAGKEKTRVETPIKTHTEAIGAVIKALTRQVPRCYKRYVGNRSRRAQGGTRRREILGIGAYNR